MNFLYLRGQSSPAVSINPSDSISQANINMAYRDTASHVSHARPGSQVSILPLGVRVQPGLRPPQYPIEILWNLEDCQRDIDVNLQDSNKSRPSMDRAVRHPDGTMISDSEWSAIKASARRIANELGALPDTARQARMRRTKMYYRTHHARDWTAAILRLETEQPLLSYCSSNWKADHVLGNSIQAMVTKETRRSKNNPKSKRKGKGKGRVVSNDGNESTDSSDSAIGRRGDVEASGASSKSLLIFDLVLH